MGNPADRSISALAATTKRAVKSALVEGEAIMADIGARTSLRDITGYQWLVLFVAWAGWSLDITDFTLYGLVLRQALTDSPNGNAARRGDQAWGTPGAFSGTDGSNPVPSSGESAANLTFSWRLSR